MVSPVMPPAPAGVRPIVLIVGHISVSPGETPSLEPSPEPVV
ncbi:hypothetical protein P3T29_006257 [Kitasatospora sp. MAP5-34]|nr:hypothetical protein [Kitasatospora sp. MAP5-34]